MTTETQVNLSQEQILLGVVTAWMAGLDPTELPQFGHFMEKAKVLANIEGIDDHPMHSTSSWDASNEALRILQGWIEGEIEKIQPKENEDASPTPIYP